MLENQQKTNDLFGFPSANLVHMTKDGSRYHLFAHRIVGKTLDTEKVEVIYKSTKFLKDFDRKLIHLYANALFTDEEVKVVEKRFASIEVHSFHNFPLPAPFNFNYWSRLVPADEGHGIGVVNALEYTPVVLLAFYLDVAKESVEQKKQAGDDHFDYVSPKEALLEAFVIPAGEVIEEVEIRAYIEESACFMFDINLRKNAEIQLEILADID